MSNDNVAASGVDLGLQNRFWKGKNRLQSWRENFRAPLFDTSRALLHRIIWHSVLIKTKVVILTSFVAHWRAPEAGRRNVWSLFGAAKFCRVAKLRPHWRCDLIDKFWQSFHFINTDLSLVRIVPKWLLNTMCCDVAKMACMTIYGCNTSTYGHGLITRLYRRLGRARCIQSRELQSFGILHKSTILVDHDLR